MPAVDPNALGRLVEIVDPPLPNRTSPIGEKSVAEKLKNTVVILSIGVVLCPAAWWLWQHGYMLYALVAGAIGLFSFVAALSGSLLQAACPYCQANIDTIPKSDAGKPIRCETCSEYSTANAGLLRPLDPATTSDPPKFESPIYRNAAWPKGCVVCGDAAVRVDDLSKTTVGLLPALAGHVQIVRGSVSGIPYCDKHRDQLSLKIGIDKKMYLCWPTLRPMRRYLAANRRRPTY